MFGFCLTAPFLSTAASYTIGSSSMHKKLIKPLFYTYNLSSRANYLQEVSLFLNSLLTQLLAACLNSAMDPLQVLLWKRLVRSTTFRDSRWITVIVLYVLQSSCTFKTCCLIKYDCTYWSLFFPSAKSGNSYPIS